MKSVIAALLLGAVALLCIVALGYVLASTPGTPSHDAGNVLQQVAKGGRASQTFGAVHATLVGAHWFDATVVPGLAGIVVGLVSGLTRRIGYKMRLMSGAIASAGLLLFHGMNDPAAWAGAVLLLSAIIGGAEVSGHIRTRLANGEQ